MTLTTIPDRRPIFYIGMTHHAAEFARRHDISQYSVKVVKSRLDVITGPSDDSIVVLGPHWIGDPGELLNIFQRVHMNKWDLVREDAYDREQNNMTLAASHDGDWVYLCWFRDEGSDAPDPLPTDKLFLYADRDLYAPFPDNFDHDCVKLVAIPAQDAKKLIQSLRGDIETTCGSRTMFLRRRGAPIHDYHFSLPLWAIGQLIYKYGGIYLPEAQVDHELLQMALRYLDQTLWHGGVLRSVLLDVELDGPSFAFARSMADEHGMSDSDTNYALDILTRVKELPESVARETLLAAQRLRVPVRHRDLTVALGRAAGRREG